MSGPQDAAEPDAPLPDAVRDLLVRCIDSVAELEALLLLVNEAQARWDAVAVARRLYIGEAFAAAALRRLQHVGLATSDGSCWRFAEACEHEAAVRALATLYTQRLVAVTGLIHGKKARGIDEFARAFVLRRGS